MWQVIMIVLVGWILVGLSVALVMIRRGHDVVIWLVLGVAAGPFAIALAGLGAYLERQIPVLKTVEITDQPRTDQLLTDRIRMLAGIDGSDAATHAVVAAATMFGARLSSVTLLTTLDYDTAFGASAARVDRIIGDAQAAAVRTLSAMGLRPHSARASGGAAEQIALSAASGHYDLIVLGSHRRRQSPLGSVTNRVAERSPIPGLIIPPARLAAATTTDATGLGTRENTP
ncbi:universal stress protein [Cryobacterium shii]|uniref:Universal stress protein n=1 Tax=Cryobacterium shii TaxID=1259235 RepID=A0AAQ2C8L1_9MICO|nr:universal stress protein [Cryobacterium shii]TFC52186.1 universal stress protein [Cryobacterium shii]